MTWWIVMAVVCTGAVLLYATQTNAGGQSAKPRRKSHEFELPDWLVERWDRAAQASKSETDSSEFPPWYFDEATPKQLQRLSEDGVNIDRGAPTKGQASDLIGLFEPVDLDDATQFAKFFGLPKPKSQTQARAQRAQMLASPDNVDRWANRPADAMEKEKLRMLAIAPAKGLTSHGARLALQRALDDESLTDAQHDDQHDLLNALEYWHDWLSEKEEREDLGVSRKPSPGQIRKAIAKMIADGASAESIIDADSDFVDALLEIAPTLDG